MSILTQITKGHNSAGKSFGEVTTLNTDGAIVHEVSAPKADPGVLTTRTTDTAGTITMDDGGHAVTTGSFISIFFSTGVSRHATVGTVSGTSVPFTLATGDVLPSAATAVKVGVDQKLEVAVDGDDVKAILLKTAQKGVFIFTEVDEVEDFAKVLKLGKVFAFVAGGSDPNPLVGLTLTNVYVSHDDTAAAAEMVLSLPYDNP